MIHDKIKSDIISSTEQTLVLVFACHMIVSLWLKFESRMILIFFESYQWPQPFIMVVTFSSKSCLSFWVFRKKKKKKKETNNFWFLYCMLFFSCWWLIFQEFGTKSQCLILKHEEYIRKKKSMMKRHRKMRILVKKKK